MKRFFTILLACVLTLPLSAQIVKTKKVAILEVVDREGQLGYGMKLQLRASLTSAITQTPGYEGYDRVDMAAIFGEHDFQRTGAVSDEQIKKLGEMSGCDYVLITEAAKIDSDNLILVAKVVNVTTGKVEANADTMITANTNNIRNGGMELAKRLLVAEKPTPQNNANASYGAPQNQINNNVSTEQTRPTTSTSNLGPRSKKTRLMVEAGLNLPAAEETSAPFALGISWGWQLNPKWFVGFYGCVGSFDTDSLFEELSCTLGIATKFHFSEQEKSTIYLGGKVGIDANGAPMLGVESGYDFGKLSAGLSFFISDGPCSFFIGPVVCYNF